MLFKTGLQDQTLDHGAGGGHSIWSTEAFKRRRWARRVNADPFGGVATRRTGRTEALCVSVSQWLI